MGFPGGSDSKESAHNVGDPGSVPGSGRSSEEGNGYLLARRIPWTEEPWWAGHDWVTNTFKLPYLIWQGSRDLLKPPDCLSPETLSPPQTDYKLSLVCVRIYPEDKILCVKSLLFIFVFSTREGGVTQLFCYQLCNDFFWWPQGPLLFLGFVGFS